MAIALWGAWGEQWALAEPVSFNGANKEIHVNAGVESLSIQTIYSAWKRWVQREQNAMYLPAMRAIGGDPIPGGATGSTFFLINGWKLCYDPSAVAVSGVLYSEDYDTAYWSVDASDPIYPATVSALVNSAVSYQNVVTGDLSSVPAAVLAQLLASIIPVNVKQINDANVIGDGTEGNDWRGVGVQPN
jgi:hypothetical protein